MKRKLHLPPLVLLWHHLAECNHVHPRSECGAVRGLKKWAVLRYRYPNPSWFFYQKNLPYKVSLAAPISKISMVKMFKHVFLFLPHADFSPGPSEPQFGTSTCTTLHLDLRNSDNKKGDQAFYDYDFSWIFFQTTISGCWNGITHGWITWGDLRSRKDWVNCFIHLAFCSASWFMQWHLVQFAFSP